MYSQRFATKQYYILFSDLIPNNIDTFREFLSKMLHNFLEFILTNYQNYQTILTFSKNYYKTTVKTFFNAETFRKLVTNNNTHIFGVYINQLLKLSNNNDFSR